jgi:hypothetical protein
LSEVLTDASNVLLSVATSETQAQAIEAMKMLYHGMSTGTKTQEVFDLQGVSSIVYGILRHSSSDRMLNYGLGALVDMTSMLSNDDKVFEALRRLDFLEKNSILAGQY